MGKIAPHAEPSPHLHVLSAQRSALSPQTTPQLPQFMRSLVVFRHAPSQH